jgi:hypothetical protein
VLCAFDMIELDGKDLRPLSEEARGDPKAIKAAIEGVISDPSGFNFSARRAQNRP